MAPSLVFTAQPHHVSLGELISQPDILIGDLQVTGQPIVVLNFGDWMALICRATTSDDLPTDHPRMKPESLLANAGGIGYLRQLIAQIPDGQAIGQPVGLVDANHTTVALLYPLNSELFVSGGHHRVIRPDSPHAVAIPAASRPSDAKTTERVNVSGSESRK